MVAQIRHDDAALPGECARDGAEVAAQAEQPVQEHYGMLCVAENLGVE